MYKIIFFLCISLLPVYAQDELYIPRNIISAYENGTRTFEGIPGKNYWQNYDEYKIKVKVEPETRLVKGSEHIVYFNNSPDTLKRIVFNIIQDLNKPETERTFSLSKEAITDGVEIEKFRMNGNNIETTDNKNFIRRNTLLTVMIEDNPLSPGSSAEFDIKWNFVIPKGRNPRMGTYDSTTFFIAYWYPQIAVYDDIDGWDSNPHSGEHEFYNDFSNYEVEITVPNTFGVWATGILQNPEEVLTSEYLKRYEEAWKSNSIINIVNADEINSGKVYNSSNNFNTWKYKANYVTDFTFGISDHFLWDATSLEVEPGRRVYIAAVYQKESKDFYEVADIAKKSIKYFSEELPAIPYPYPSLTVFNGRGGMEFPMIINDGSHKQRSGTVAVTSHEIAHQYFPFYMGISEEKYGWMDEGMATFFPFDFQVSEGNAFPWYNAMRFYERMAGSEFEVPPMTLTYMLRGWSKTMAIYYRPAFAYFYLRDMLGKELFNKCMAEYIKRWNGKHPIPYDFLYTFNEVSGENLNWYWKPWFFEKGYPDLAITNVVYSDNILEVEIKKKGNIPVPVMLSIFCEDESILEVYETAGVWKESDLFILKKELTSDPVSLILGSDLIPDSEQEDNMYSFPQSTN